MIRLPYTNTYSLELITAQNGADVACSFSDATSTGYNGGIQTASIIFATTTTICNTPAASTVRDIDSINIKNTYAGSHTITVQLDGNGTNIPLITAALLENESLNYTHGSGWQCKDSNGSTKTSSAISSMTSAQLAATITDETGSGAAVFATSPTLVTPLLGTPASGNLSSCTNYPIAVDIHAASSKAVPVDADEVGGTDSAAGFALIRITWANVKASIKTYFDTLYASLSGATFTGLVNFKTGANIASAATLNLSTATGNTVHITGIVATSAVTMNAGQWVECIADGAWPLTYHATNNNINSGGVNVTLAAGDRVLYFYDGTTIYGNIIKQNGSAIQIKPAFSVHKNGVNQIGIVTSTFTKLTWSTELFDTNNNFATDRFTPTVAGKYQLSAGLLFTTAADQAYMQIALYKNGAVYTMSPTTTSGIGGQGSNISRLVDANGSTDYFEIYAYQTSGTNKDISGSSVYTYFTGCKVD